MPPESHVTIKNGPLPTMLGSIVAAVKSGDGADYHNVVHEMERRLFADAVDRCAGRLPPEYLKVDLDKAEPRYEMEIAGLVRNAYVLGLLDGARRAKERSRWRRVLRWLRLRRTDAG